MQEGQYTQYPRPPIREIDFGVVSEAFQLIFKHWQPMLTASFLGYFIPYCAIQVLSIVVQYQLVMLSPTASSDLSTMVDKIGPFFGMFILASIGLGFIIAPFGYAITKMTLKSARGEPVEFSDTFCGFPKLGQSIVTVVGTYLLAGVGIFACCIGLPIVGGLLMFTLPLVIDKGMSPIEAMRTSFEMLRPHIWMAMLLFIVYTILYGIGALACLVGLIVTFPLYFVIPALVYRDFTMGRGTPVPTQYETPNPYPTEPTNEGTTL